jgi:beta-galactosidase
LQVEPIKDPISFNFSCYTQEALEQTAHNFELEKAPYHVLCLDYKLEGIGSNSCGPRPLGQYLFNEQKFTFSFCLIPQ